MTRWETVIGLEIHVRLLTRSKLFSGTSTAYGAEPNTLACAVDLGLPGVLPAANEEVFRKAVRFGLGINAEISRRSVFDRKNYFYPDLPKGYQISQLYLPVVGKGELEINWNDGNSNKVIGVTRAHLEEDAGKSLHEDFAGMSGIDLNRAGTPLLEIVSEPDMRSADEAVAYMKAVHTLVRYLEISDGNMQEGSFRCDANVSVRAQGRAEFGTRTEIKNLNSFRFVERAINHEVERQTDILENGGEVIQETRLYDSDRDETRSMRSKEEANDYRYFPDPDLLPVIIDDDYIEAVRQSMPELPDTKRHRFIQELGLNAHDATVLTGSREMADYYEAVLAEAKAVRLSANWVIVELFGALNRDGLDIRQSPVSAKRLAGIIRRIADKTISGKTGKQVFEEMWCSKDDADTIIEAKGLRQITDSGAIEGMIDKILADSPRQIEQYRTGQKKVLGYFVGQVMKASRGRADPQQVNAILLSRLRD